ncbi:hypothetical protein M3661_27990 [Paenibacillus sp. MER 180]|uniref:YkoP family protein n=1 Tax=unclassified Paenibacillus TaxID=185978 RepID=UPI0008065E51|nr:MULTISPECIES: hypothetical protein [unclassified Paenibacillus]MCM3293941.1 hypothetical protein [Paenibacillus sp. MER 180]OBY80512.1 hypothetical protein BBG47_05685 [Paenibacillus sp. KS1]
MKLKMLILFVWSMLDPIYFSLTRLTFPEQSRSNIFRVRLLRYRGKTIILSDGTRIEHSDLLVKIHLHNVRLLTEIFYMENGVKKGRIIYRTVEQSLPGVCRHIQAHPKFREIKAIIGITMLHRGCTHLGFDIVQIHNPLYHAFKWIGQMPIHFLSVSNPLKTCTKQNPRFLLMSTDLLMDKYGSV